MNRRTQWVLGSIVAVLLGACAGISNPRPGASGFAPDRIERLKSVVRADVEKGRIPGVVLLVARDGQLVLHEAIGVQNPASSAPMRTDSIFRIYSMTKPLVSVATMMLIEEGRLQLSDPVSRYLPELKGLKVGVEKKDAAGQASLEIVAAAREMTVYDLLRHTSGLTYGEFGKSMVKDLYAKNGVNDRDHSNADLIKKLTTVPLMFQPGETWEYSRSTDVLGHLLERVTGQDLDRVLDERIIKPLGMRDTGFFVGTEHQSRIAEPFAKEPETGAAVILLPVREKPKYLAGGQGLVSTGADYLRFAQMLLNGGELDGVRILSRKTVEFMTSDHLGGIRGGPAAGYGFGLGFAVRASTGQSPAPGSAGEYNWGGLGGTYFWIDPKERLVAIWMMQSPHMRVHYRGIYRDLVYGALVN